MSKIATGTRSKASRLRRLLLPAAPIRAPRLPRGAVGIARLDVRVDAREHKRDQRGKDHLPQLEEHEPQTAHETTAHDGTLASDVPGHATRWRRPSAFSTHVSSRTRASESGSSRPSSVYPSTQCGSQRIGARHEKRSQNARLCKGPRTRSYISRKISGPRAPARRARSFRAIATSFAGSAMSA